MSLLTMQGRGRRFKALELGDYNKTNILKFQKKAFKDKSMHDGIYGQQTDNALRTFYNVKVCAPNFKPEEFRCTCGHCSGYPSYMKQVELKNLQKIRDHYNRPMIVTSGLRCKYDNQQSSGSIQNSLHLVGRACDFYMAGVTDTLEHRKSFIKWAKTLSNTHYIYGQGINSNGYSVYAPYMGNAVHYDTNKVQKKKTKSTYHSEKTIIGQACCNEFGKLSGGKPGDQTGREVCLSNWSSGYGWIYMFRHKDPAVRLEIAQYAIDTCNNQNIGYNIDVPNRYAAWDNAEANGHNIKAIKKKGDTTCSQMVSMILRAIGTPKKYAPRHMDIAVMTSVMPKNPDFKMYKSAAYTKRSDKLLPGDILLSSHHTAIVVKSPNAK